MWVDPVTRYIHITYTVPEDAPEEVLVQCSWSPPGKDEWRSARVTPLLSETGIKLTSEDEWQQWTRLGKIIERRAAGLERTVVFNPYPDAQVNGLIDTEFRVQIRTPEGRLIGNRQLHIQADNSDVIYIQDWSQILQRDALSADTESEERKWTWNPQAVSKSATTDQGLSGKPGSTPLPQLTYPLDLKGCYMIYTCGSPEMGSVRLRLTGDERADHLRSRHSGEETFWRTARMDRQHLVIQQPGSFNGYLPAHINYIKLVPAANIQSTDCHSALSGKPDKLVAGYFEPYSWAFYENVQSTLQHREPLGAFADAGVHIIDIQVGRFGAKAVYESRTTDQLLYETIGDPIHGVVPETGNVGRMQQYTNTLETEIRYSQELGLVPHANFGATNCYPGSPLQGNISKERPDWCRGHALRYELPEVREYILSLFREVLEIGAPGISIDFCRYPQGIDKPETCTQFLRALRKLADEFSPKPSQRIPVLVRFPAKGVRLWEHFEYQIWAREGLVDYLCPSNIQGRHLQFDIAPYVKAVKGTKCKLLPVVDGLHWGLTIPGPVLWRVRQLYDAGADGVYIYQADAPILGWPDERRCIRMLGSSRAVRKWWEEEEERTPQRSKRICITPAVDKDVYKPWERLRVWLEGIRPAELKLYLDGKEINTYSSPPYLLGTEEYSSDRVIGPGEHVLRIQAKDGDGWLEQEYKIHGASGG